MGQIEDSEKKRKQDRRGDFPELAGWVDAVREVFGAEAAGELIEPGGAVRRWGRLLPVQPWRDAFGLK